MMNMSSIASGKYDLVVHSDTLEHVPDPVAGPPGVSPGAAPWGRAASRCPSWWGD